MPAQKSDVQVLSGTIRNLKVENTTAEVFFRTSDGKSMAATGAVAAAMGLSGIAAGMVAMSAEETREPVTKASFDLDGRCVETLLWNWPFKEGDQVQVVANASGSNYIGFAVIDPKEKIIALYPHVSAGSVAHWKNVVKISLMVGFGISAITCSFIMFMAVFSMNDWETGLKAVSINVWAGPLLFLWVGYRIGRRFKSFTSMAEEIFSSLGWSDVKNINLRKLTKTKRKPSDPPAMGDSYFRY